jgi:hypothetical protein
VYEPRDGPVFQEGYMIVRRLRPALAGAVFLSAIATSAAPAAAPGLAAIGAIEAGQWQLRETGNGKTRSLCVSDAQVLLQIHHSGAQCSRFVIENSASVATIHYTCPGQGHGRTTISVETPRLIRVDTQGVAQGAPFAVEMEGRRTGACLSASASH